MKMKLYHGTNLSLSELRNEAWLTGVIGHAIQQAGSRVEKFGGEKFVHVVEVDECDVREVKAEDRTDENRMNEAGAETWVRISTCMLAVKQSLSGEELSEEEKRFYSP
jgi:hypothetical protein